MLCLPETLSASRAGDRVPLPLAGSTVQVLGLRHREDSVRPRLPPQVLLGLRPLIATVAFPLSTGIGGPCYVRSLSLKGSVLERFLDRKILFLLYSGKYLIVAL